MSARILLVEDNEVNQYLATFVLEKAGFVVVAAVDGEAALDAARREQPDLILMDLRMPQLDGYETTLRLKADPVLRSIPVVALSAQVMPQDRARALEVGCVALLDKPIDAITFADQVRALIAAHTPPH